MTEDLLPHPNHEPATDAEVMVENAQLMAALIVENYELFHKGKKPAFEVAFVMTNPLHKLAHAMVWEELWIEAVPEDSTYFLTGEDTKLFFTVLSEADGEDGPVPEVICYSTEPPLAGLSSAAEA